MNLPPLPPAIWFGDIKAHSPAQMRAYAEAAVLAERDRLLSEIENFPRWPMAMKDLLLHIRSRT